MPGLKTCPVGPLGPPMLPGMVTTSGLMLPAPSYKVAVPVPWLETQKGEVAEKDMPQGLMRLGSVCAARPETLETRFVWVKVSAWAAGKISEKARKARDKRIGG